MSLLSAMATLILATCINAQAHTVAWEDYYPPDPVRELFNLSIQ
jgi:hypothetical protein